MAAATQSSGILYIGHIVRFNPRYRMAKQAIDEGRIGKIVSLSSRRNIPAVWTPTILDKIGPIVGDAIHDTDIMLWFTGDRVISAYAQTVDVRGLKHPDIGQTMYRFAKGASATLETVWCMPEKTPFDIDERMSIVGTEASSISRTHSRTLPLSMVTSSIRPIRLIGPCLTACVVGLCETNSAILPPAQLKASRWQSAQRKMPRRLWRRRWPPRNRHEPAMW